MKYKYFLLLLVLFASCNSLDISKNAPKKAMDSSFNEIKTGFKNPETKYRPETWFHLMGNNISKEGLTADLEAIKKAGLQGIHLFNKSGSAYPNVEQIKILSPEWENMIRHAADECQRLGLKFTMQNCPGWSMTGGPWVPVEEAQREVVETTYRFKGGDVVNQVLVLDSLYITSKYDYKDIQLVAFQTPEGDDRGAYNPIAVSSNNTIVPWKEIFNPNSKLIYEDKSTKLNLPLETYRKEGISKVEAKDSWVITQFSEPITIRSIVFPPLAHVILEGNNPIIKTQIKVEALINGKLEKISTLQIPEMNWCDRQLFLTMAIPETTAQEFKFTFEGEHAIAPEFIRLYAKPRLHNHEAKAAKAMRVLEKNVVLDYAPKTIIKSQEIIDLSKFLSGDGKLNWTVPEGNWTLVRFGHVNMRRTNKPAVPEATGWESSKLDKLAIENHLKNGMIGNLIKPGGPIGDGKLHGLLIDSWESYIPTWTMNSEDFFKEFESRRDYSMKSFLPATLGYIIDSPSTTTKFLRDLRHTMDDVYVDNFFSHFATVAHQMGAQVYTEAAGGEVLPIDPMRYYGVSDIPMTEFWYPKAPTPQNEYSKPIFSASSAVHIYNKPLLAAEALTQVGVKWNEHPFTVKYLMDYNFTKGVNHLVFHTFSHTPQMDVYPGSSFGGNIGYPLVRNQTWWKYMPEWIDYISRNQYVLQQGKYAADVLWYIGDHFERPPHDLDYFPKGYRFDFLNAEVLQQKLSVKDGKIQIENAGDYKVILLKDAKEMLLSTAKKLKELVLAGAVILGDKPIDSPSLMDDATDLIELKNIANELWGTAESGVKQVGKGKVYWGKSLESVLDAEKIAKDVIVPDGLAIHWIHRKTADADVYFVSSQLEKPVDLALSFNVKDVYPQIWDAFTGEQQEAKIWNKDNARTNVTLSLPSNGSAIVVFEKGNKQPFATKVSSQNTIVLDSKTGWYKIHEDKTFENISWKGEEMVPSKSANYTVFQNSNTKNVSVAIKEIPLQNDWKASFETGWDAPNFIQINELKSLSLLDDKAVQHYSGTTTYTKSFNLDKLSNNTTLDLGAVANIAEVWCNGKKIGTKWAPPFTFDLTNVVKKGENQLEVKVTNTWRNQLIYDNSRPNNQKKTWTSNPPTNEEVILEVAGLIGPVVIRLKE